MYLFERDSSNSHKDLFSSKLGFSFKAGVVTSIVFCTQGDLHLTIEQILLRALHLEAQGKA